LRGEEVFTEVLVGRREVPVGPRQERIARGELGGELLEPGDGVVPLSALEFPERRRVERLVGGESL